MNVERLIHRPCFWCVGVIVLKSLLDMIEV